MNALIESLNAHAPGILRWLAGFELQIAALAVLVWLLDRWLRKSTPLLRYSLWLVVLAKGFIPPFIALRAFVIPVAVLKAAPMSAAAATGAVATPASSSVLPVLSTSAPSLSLWSLVLIAWVLVALVLLCVAVWRSVALHRRLRGAVALSDWSDRSDKSDRFANLPRKDAKRKPRIYVTNAIDTPLTTGIFQPKIYLTPELAASDSAALRSVLQHELAHVRRQDLWIVLLQNLASVLHPVNPFLRLMNTKLHQYREMICDEHALRESKIDAQAYGQLLLDLVERKIRKPRFTADAIYFFETKKGLKERILRIAGFCEETVNRLRVKHYALVIVLCVALVPFAWQCSNEKLPYKTAPTYSMMQFNDFTMLSECDSLPVQTWGSDINSDPIYILQASFKRDEKKELDEQFIFKVRLNASGEVKRVLTVKGFNHAGAQDLVQAIFKSKWRPATKGDRPVEAEFLLPVRFYQTNKESLVRDHDKGPYDTPPQPVGGLEAVFNALTYPEDALEKGIEGTVLLQVTVLSNKWIDKVLVLSSPDESLSKAAVKAVQSVPWTPALYKGMPISWADVQVPVKFALQAKEGGRKH